MLKHILSECYIRFINSTQGWRMIQAKSAHLIITFIFILSAAATDYEQCSSLFSTEQQQFQKDLNDFIVKQLGQQVKPQPSYLLDFIKYLKSKNFFLNPYSEIAQQQQNIQNQRYVNRLALLFFTTVFIYFIIPFARLYSKKIPQSYQKHPWKILKIILAVVCILILYESLRGVKEGFKQSKSADLITCKLTNEPNFIKNKQVEGYGFEGLQNHLLRVQRAIQRNLSSPLQQLAYQVKNSQKTLKILNLILNSLQDSQKKGIFEFELLQARNILSKVYNDNYMQSCQSKLMLIGEQLINFTSKAKAITRAIANDHLQDFKIKSSLKIYTSSVTTFFILLTTLIIVTFKKISEKANMSIQFAIGLAALICVGFSLSSPAILTHLYWCNGSISQILSNQENIIHLYQQIASSKPESIAELSFFKKSPIFSMIKCFSQAKENLNLYKMIISEDDEYFYHLSLKAQSKIKQQKRQELMRLINQNHVSLNGHVLASLKKLYESQVFFVQLFKEGGDIDAIHPYSFAEYLKQLLTTLAIHPLNRFYSLTSVFANLSKLLILLFGLSFLTIENRKQQILNSQNNFIEVDTQDLQNHPKQ